ncbi:MULTISPECIES: hypothetical protein [unclassified Variovorax]|uniref:hypothetical protein n=1 Tax=unclassified Variovorax TaxID=663243 RepID=UPI0013191A2E|nr:MULTISPECIES: hypothetical protein [unclassified Variovorax]VTU27733.1 hypothetical protein SRS16CHR_04125 [Variovorax sp. SRS16]VTU35452.1 hypothetical protein E5CHR_04068 [Variovorax sp. PBL-E5]
MKHPAAHVRDGVERLIVDYLKAHPRAADSAEGIRRWWLGDSGAAASAEEIERALAQLVGEGLMRRVSLADGTQLYSRGVE